MTSAERYHGKSGSIRPDGSPNGYRRMMNQLANILSPHKTHREGALWSGPVNAARAGALVHRFSLSHHGWAAGLSRVLSLFGDRSVYIVWLPHIWEDGSGGVTPWPVDERYAEGFADYLAIFHRRIGGADRHGWAANEFMLPGPVWDGDPTTMLRSLDDKEGEAS